MVAQEDPDVQKVDCSRRFLFQSLSSGGQADALPFIAVDGVLHSVLVLLGVPDDLPAEVTLHLAVGAQHLPVSGALHIQGD